MLAGTGNVLPNGIYLCFWNEVSWFVEWQAITCGMLMPVMKITIRGDMNVAAFIQQSPKQSATKARWTALNQSLRTGYSG